MANQPKKYKKFVATAATATLVASAIVPVASAASLSDIAGNTHEEAITSLVDAGVINGYPDGTFQPNKTLTRSDVVKLLGKYLVAKGLEVPADYKTNVRFNDLSSASNDELLKYAAVVYDAGVFNGSNGNLLAGDNITRENMAVVLVRAFDTLNNIDLVSYVQGQEYKKDVKDLYTAKSEARSAIEVLDFFDITNPSVANFNPKGSTTRGQFATFLYKTINTDFSAVTGVANSAVSEIKAINNTTVEVTFKEAVDNKEALDFTIEGLEVKNAVVKQTDAKTFVLTTAPQTGDTVYTLNVNAAKAGTFKGVSAVIPTAIDLVQKSTQGVLGKEVTLKAQVTVAEGQSKAGIPVTFSIPAQGSLVPAVTVEAFTNAEGVATYTYTRYAAETDAVTVYATGDRSKFSTGYVFWGVATTLVVEEVTTGSTVNNGSNKTYKVTYLSRTTGQPVPNAQLNVSFLENINVSVDKISGATVNGTNPVQLANGTKTDSVEIFTDSKGVATFTVSGVNTEVTPVVWVPTYPQTNVSYSEAYAASLLQTTAPKVTFSAVQAAYTMEITAEGSETAATGLANGRKYKIVVKDKNGNVAKNENVNLRINETYDGVISTNSNAQFIEVASNGTHTRFIGQTRTVKTNDKGEATFVIGSDDQTNLDYATPFAWIDINSHNTSTAGALDQGEPTATGPKTFFTAPVLTAGALTVIDTLGEEEDKFDGDEPAYFTFNFTNQSGKTYNLATSNYDTVEVTYTVTNTGANEISVNNGDYTVSPNRSVTVRMTGTAAALPTLKVESIGDKTTSAEVTASAVAYDNATVNPLRPFTIATTAKASATFTSTTAVTNTYTGIVDEISTTGLKFVGKNKESFGSTTKFFGGNGAEIFGAQNFVDAILAYGGEVRVTLIKDADGNKTFKIVSGSANGDAPVNTDAVADVEDAIEKLTSTSTVTSILAAYDAYNALTTNEKADVENVTDLETAIVNATNAVVVPAIADATDYTTTTWTALTTAQGLPTTTLAQKATKLEDLTDAASELLSAVEVTSSGLTLTFEPAVTDADVTLEVDSVTASTVGATATAGTYDAATGELVITFTDATPAALATNDTIEVDVEVNGESQTLTLTYDGTEWDLTGSPVTIR